jgi:predicted PurR-regulated permease PerM
VVILLAVLLWLLYRLAPVLTPFAMAAALAYLGDPLVDRLQRWKIRGWTCSRTLAVTIVFLFMSLLLLGVLLIVIPMTLEQVRHLIDRMPDMVEWVVVTAIPWLEGKSGLSFPELDAAAGQLADEFRAGAGGHVLPVARLGSPGCRSAQIAAHQSRAHRQ